MFFSHILNYFDHISKSIGLPPVVLVCTIALFFFFFIFGLVILTKAAGIRKNLVALNRELRILNQKIQTETASLRAEINNLKKSYQTPKFEYQKQDAKKNGSEISIRRNLHSETDDQNGIQFKNSADLDLKKDEIAGSRKKVYDVKNKILLLLKMSGRPMSFSEIAKYLSKVSPDHDFESMLKQLEQLKAEGEIISQVSAGKLYFKKK
ncbi:MAG: hypothetical protein JSW26_07575 [Desulfobacterales bacterium]|nr:MAG: hypothetical protein JSW26_07575 [Desulfobacterales bacterium]